MTLVMRLTIDVQDRLERAQLQADSPGSSLATDAFKSMYRRKCTIDLQHRRRPEIIQFMRNAKRDAEH
ncbi:hypothetical protein [Stenotrophomonas sp. Iso1]|uniref:hypothetical protein n=1 Tax=Stenotrophomonas sp. Iso1 TaxID=2977283 RepID=UPI0022B77C66|nr:hypothetical protein [Stenotrophomonas sp. Iso1]